MRLRLIFQLQLLPCHFCHLLGVKVPWRHLYFKSSFITSKILKEGKITLSDKFDTGFLIVLFTISLQAWLIKVKGLQGRVSHLANLSCFENNMKNL